MQFAKRHWLSSRSLLSIALLGWGGAVTFQCRTANEPVDFNTQIRPLLNTSCLRCHGGVKQAGGVSLLFRDEAIKAGKSGKRCIVPGHPEESELIARLQHTDPDERMPLNGDPMTPDQIDLIKKWVAQGANWEDHWAYVPPKPQPVPDVRSDWVKTPIDAFVYDRLDKEGMAPSPEADRATLLRRVSLDLAGLPPTDREQVTFQCDKSADAYEKAVDRLLESPHFGERWAALWLDLARYGDSQGYQKDKARTIWPYRDWVINAFNEDMPFDRFTVEQLAGDLLPSVARPNTNTDQLIATAFHRNTMSNDEGGTDDEEFRTVAVLDRVNTTFEVWQGTTIGCVQCHTHPYDPIRHKEYYQLTAYFNNTADADKPDDRPTLRAQTSRQQAELKSFFGTLPAALTWPIDSLPTRLRAVKLPVMQELPADSSRTTHVFVRGNWLVHGDVVRPGLPQSLTKYAPATAVGQQNNRLDLARWIVSADNPLTARVLVNRFWEQLFGLGLVETVEDFGTQGAKPSHPELLDYLALRFRDQYRWSAKKLLRELVLSATYRQSSVMTPVLRERDSQNRLLARGPRVRLTAEQVRDQALSVSGLITPTMYGPPVMPPQPDGVWQVIRNVMKWKAAEGPDRYRRAIYTFWRKSSPYPSFTTFDSPSRELCVSRRVRTNTPLQALVTLNDPVYWEAAQALASRMQRAGGGDPAKAIRAGGQLLLGAPLSDRKEKLLVRYYQKALQHYRESSIATRKSITLKTLIPSPELAALTATANVILNLDEAVTKE